MTDMSPAEAIFFAALEKTTPEQRAAYLDEACGNDADLRRRVDRLLAAHPQVGSFLGQAVNTIDVEPCEGIGSVLVGRYKLLEAIGEGGMGSVFMAQQTEPVKRLVAVKLIKTGMDSKQILARFEAERQALALMDHPNIAKVLDAGTAASGRPFFVMELVKGTPITKFCDDRRLSPRERLELFVPVCQAIQHAHQKGIIHRDIKPSNVLIALYDGKPVPKVIDFGVAKAAGQPLTDRTLVTGFGAIVGTLEYMSPEQAETNQLDVDTRSDVYALGVLLYELLTGTTPIGRERLKTAALLEVLRLVREEEAPRPSVRLSSSEGLPSIALNRQMEPAKLSRLMRGELDWIVMKALEKDRTRRYETANGLAQDVQRYLADEQVEACPPSAGYRLRKFLRRHKGPVLAAALVLLALVGGVIGTTWGLVRAERARDAEATQRAVAVENEKMATAAAKSEQEAKEEAQQRAEDARIAARKEAQSREQAETEKRAAQFQSLRADTARHAILTQAGLRAWEQHDVVETERLLAEDTGSFRQTWEHRYLRGLCRRQALPLLVDAGVVGERKSFEYLPVSFSPDGKLLVTGGGEINKPGKVKVWDTQTGQELLALEGHALPVVGVCFSPDGKQIASSSMEVKVWDAVTGEEVLTLKGHSMGVYGVCFSPDGKQIASASYDGTVKVWDARTGKELLAFEVLGDSVRNVCFSPDGKRLASGTGKGLVKLWDAQTGKELLSIKGHFGVVTSVSFSPDGQRLASGSEDGLVKLWDAQTTKELLFIRGHRGGVSSVSFSPDGQRLASGSRDSSVRVWDARTGQELLILKGHTGWVVSVSFSPDGKRLASGSWDRTVKIWDTAAGQEQLFLKGHTQGVNSVVFRPDGKRLASGSADGLVKLWDAATGQELLSLKGHTLDVWGVSFSPDGQRLASGGEDGLVKLWDAATGQELFTLKGHTDRVHSVNFSPDGKRLASASWDGTVKLWDAVTGQELLNLDGHTRYVLSVCFSPDGKRVASDSGDQTVTVWDAVTGRELLNIKGHTAGVQSVIFSPDGKRLATASGDKTVMLWDAATGQELLTLKGHTNMVRSVIFSPDGKRLVSASWDRTVKLWDAQTGQELLTLKGKTNGVLRGAVAPGRFYEQEMLFIKGLNDGVLCVSFSPDGQRIISGGEDGTVKVWDAPPLPER